MTRVKAIELNNENVTKYVEALLPRIDSLKELNYSVSSAEEITEQTYVNYIFRATLKEKDSGKEHDIYLRQSRDHVKAAPDKKFDPTRISYEIKIINFLNTLVKDLIPEILHYDVANNVAVLTDIKIGCPLLVNELIEGRAHPETGEYFGKQLALLHGKTYGIKNEKVRGSKKENDDAIKFHLGMRLEPAQQNYKAEVDKLLKDGLKEQRCLVLGDLASKNIFVDGDRIRFLDLERSFVGDPAFDLAFLFCHYLIEVKPEDLRGSLDFIKNFMNSYKEDARNYLSDDEVERFENRVIRYLGITILYRLHGFYLVVNVERNKEVWNEIAYELIQENDSIDLTRLLESKALRFD